MSLRRRVMLTSVSVLSVLLAATGAHARSLNGGGAGGVVGAPNIASEAATQAAQQAAAAARQSQDSLARAARAVQDMQAVQAAARTAAAAAQTTAGVPNGIGAGGLLPHMPQNWSGANGPTQSVDAAGQTQVNIRQTTQQAILDWQSFNVGARTTLTFDQQGNSSWTALNRVINSAAPSQILGNIKADGQVLVINRNGIIFGGNSQVNVGSLIASTAEIDVDNYRTNGIYSAQTNGYTPNFTVAGGKVVVQAGAEINTHAPSSVTAGGGFVLMIGSAVENAGSIATPKGQTLLAAGDDFVLRQGFSTTGNAPSTTRGIELAPSFYDGSTNGQVTNTGLIFAQQGDITLAGRTLTQGGVMLASTSVNTRGTIHLLNSASDNQGSVTLAAGSVTAILPELESSETALDSQRDALIAASDDANLNRATFATGRFDNLSLLVDRQDQSRIEIVTGGTVNFRNQSQTMAQGGQIAVSAGTRVFAETGASIDVSGTRDVLLPMSANQVLVNIQGNELRDSPQNRDSGLLLNQDVWIDIRDLVLVAAGTGGYASDRYYTQGGLLELGGHLANTSHKIGEWTAVGGSITLAGPEVVAQQGARFDISGGAINYEGGNIYSTKLVGSDGRVYSFDNAPADMKFSGVAGGFSRTHNIQGAIADQLTERWTSVFDRSTSSRYEEGYTVGRDAGRLILSTPTALFEADIIADVITGERQKSARVAAVTESYKQVQNAAPLAGTLALGLYSSIGLVDLHSSDVRIGKIGDITAGIGLADLLPADRSNTVWLDADRISGQGLGGLQLGTRGKIAIESNLVLANGGVLDLTASVVDIKANVTAHGGSVSASNRLVTQAGGTLYLTSDDGSSKVTLGAGAVIDVSGVKNIADASSDADTLAHLNGGSVSLQSSQDVAVERGAVIDVTSGVGFASLGKIQGGRGGNVTLKAGLDNMDPTGELTLAGDLRGYGLNGGDALQLQAGRVMIGGVAEAGTLALDTGLFSKGFSAYTIAGNSSVAVADGTVVNVTMPVYRYVPGGADTAAGLEVWTPELYLENIRTGAITQRGGASLTLQAGNGNLNAVDLAAIDVSIGKNAVINVDPGQSIALSSVGQLTVDGALHAAGGRIALTTINLLDTQADLDAVTTKSRSIWIGENARLDVAAQAVTARDARGNRTGLVASGGSIVIGGEINAALGQGTASNNFIVIRPGAVLDASGTHAILDIAGQGAVDVASNGGSISIASNVGMFLDGAMIARAGGAGAAGGSLNVSLQMPFYLVNTFDVNVPNADPAYRTLRQIILANKQGDSVLRADLQAGEADEGMAYGYARLGADTLARGGFDNLSVMSTAIAFDGSVNLRLGQSLNLYSDMLIPLAGSAQGSRIAVSAPYLQMGQINYVFKESNPSKSRNPLYTAPETRYDIGFNADADLIDIRDTVNLTFGPSLLQSSGDLRLLAAVRPLQSQPRIPTNLINPGSLTLRAAQVYPTTGTVAQIQVGLSNVQGTEVYDPDQILRIEAMPGATPALPYSVFGDLTLAAANIEQAGVLRAPLGKLTLGMSAYEPANTTEVRLLPGSVTSVSGAGLLMPYGGTVDGLTYSYDGKTVTLLGAGGIVGSTDVSTTLKVGIEFGGRSAIIESGALLDMSGGGNLTGAGFITGRGGSVDVLTTAFANANPGNRFSAAGNKVYAIVPGYLGAYAPGASGSDTGRQITLDGSVPGLPAGTYTLMPASYALLPGAFRIEIGAQQTRGVVAGANPVGNGSYTSIGQLSVAHTAIKNGLMNQVVVTPSAAIRSYSQYNETSYADFVLADAEKRGIPRGMLPADARTLLLRLNAGAGIDALRVDGTARFDAAQGGSGGVVMVTADQGPSTSIEVVAGGAGATAGYSGITLDSTMLNAFGASRLVIGGMQYVNYGSSGRLIETFDRTLSVYLRSGSLLAAPEVFLMANGGASQIVVEQGARINTIGMGATAYDSRDGYVYGASGNQVMVSNGVLTLVPNTKAAIVGTSGVYIGTCNAGICSGQTEIYSEGTVALVTPNQFQLDDAVRYGTRNLTLAVGRINLGDTSVLADAAARDVLPNGLALNQAVLTRLLRGDTSYGAPALETLTLSASNAVNIFGSVTLDTLDPVTGKSTLANLVLGTPAIYGAGNAGDTATIRTGNLIWQGSTLGAGEVIAGGAGTGSGTLNVEAEQIVFGYGATAQPSGNTTDGRLILGFANVNLVASDRVSANQKGSLAVYQSRGAYVDGQGYSYSGGNLTINTPLVTGEGGSVNAITAGGALRLVGSGAGGAVGSDALGAQLTLGGSSVVIDTAIALPSGTLTVKADGDILLTDAARIDLAGREVVFVDVSKYSWGGEVTFDSRGGTIRQATGSVIDVSAHYNNAGSVTAIALDGTVDLAGSIAGNADGYYDAGGTLVPYRAGSATIRANNLGDFAALNARLTAGGVFGARSFQIKQGDLTIGNELKANEIDVSIDNGHLTVVGTIDASGESVGTIRLAAKNGLTLTGSAVLDAHGTVLRVDSYGKIIDSPNRAIVELSSGDGRLTLAQGARIDLRHGTSALLGSGAGQNDGLTRGTLELNAPRIGSSGSIHDADAATFGDIDIDVAGMPTIQGARSIAVNAMRSYDDARTETDPANPGRSYQVIDQAWLDAKHADSETFIKEALRNTALLNNKLAGLNNTTYRDTFHLRPGVQAISNVPDGDLVVQGDLDLSIYRYASLNPNSQLVAGIAGSGEAGALLLRAGGDLSIYGSITDGFAAPPPVTSDDNGWLLLAGKEFTGADITIPRTGIVLGDGTVFLPGMAFNFDAPIQAASFVAGTVIPVASSLSAPMNLVAGTVVTATVRDELGNVLYAAGSIIKAPATLPVGTRFDAGMKLPVLAWLNALTWPKGVALPYQQYTTYLLNGDIPLPVGAIVPAGTDIHLPDGAKSVELRPGGAGKLFAISAMLPEGSQSWSMRLVAGADLGAADTRLVNPHAARGSLILADNHYGVLSQLTPGSIVLTYYGWQMLIGDGDPADFVGRSLLELGGDSSFCDMDPLICGMSANPTFNYIPASTRFSVLRTGAADLDLLSARNLAMNSLYGVYTAGTSSTTTSANDPYNLPRATTSSGNVLGDISLAYEKFVNGGAESLARAWYPTGGGNLTIKAGGNLSGDLMTLPVVLGGLRPNTSDVGYNSADIGNWLWRQGTGGTFGNSADQPTAWWINFGTYVSPTIGGYKKSDTLVGFTGFGTLGGGDLRVDVGGDAGILTLMGNNQVSPGRLDIMDQYSNPRTQGLVLAVGSTGRVGADGSLTLTGGGDLDLRVKGALNPASMYREAIYNGTVTNLRGDTSIAAASIGSIQRLYGVLGRQQMPSETRAYDVFTASRVNAVGGMVLAPGDSVFTVTGDNDLVLTGASDPGRVTMAVKSPYSADGASDGNSWFTLWTGRSAINLFSAGGDVVPLNYNNSLVQTDSALMYPPTLTAVAAGGSLYYGVAVGYDGNNQIAAPLLLAPSATGKLEFLASESIYAGGFSVARSGAAASSLATPFKPAFSVFDEFVTGQRTVNNLSAAGSEAVEYNGIYPLFAFGPNTAAAASGSLAPALFYAAHGDLVGVSSGRIVTFEAYDPTRAGQVWYQGAGPVRMIAGGDIVGSGTRLGTVDSTTSSLNNTYFTSTGNLFVHNGDTDMSLVQVGHDIIYSSFNIAGPGTLQVSAGRNIQMDDKASIISLGSVVPGDTRPGASIAVQAGVGATGPNYAALLRYLDPANQLPTGTPLDGSGKVAKTYEKELAAWLKDRYGFSGNDEDARIYFGGLAAEQQQIFLRQVYFAELTAGGREYNDPSSPRYQSYLRGREAIAGLFPDSTASGDIIMFKGSGVRTIGGGDIAMLTPAGRLIVGVEGEPPPATAGLVTQGAGNVQIYSQGSVLLGLSRIMTTFGGSILAWSATGDINAGRGSKTTQVYTPPKRVYDIYGNATLSPVAPSSGAGIATLNPIPEVKAGDIDLIAPLGTIDAGEAGIRVSGNINLAALQLVNTANIQVQGSSSGIPVVQAPNISAALSSSNATTATQQTATPTQTASAQASVIIVEVLGYGGGSDSDKPEKKHEPEEKQTYNANAPVRVVAYGPVSAADTGDLTEEEKRALRR